MGYFRGVGTLARSTYRDITHRAIYYIILLVLAGMVFFSQYITLFSFNQEMNMVREMGIATITFFGFLIIVILTGVVVTKELEDRTAITLLSKPISRPAFLLGKFFGIMYSITPAILILSGTLFLTLWLMAMPSLYGKDSFMWVASNGVPVQDRIPVMQEETWATLEVNPETGQLQRKEAGGGVWTETWACLRVCWQYFILTNGGVALEGAYLCFLQIAILAALCVSLSTFTPVLFSTASTALLFILGNISSYMLAAVERWNIGALSFGARGLYYLLPNLGYFNLQTFFSEGRIISIQYLGFASLYAVLYSISVFLISCAAFQRREIR